jgi:hypothetical protein
MNNLNYDETHRLRVCFVLAISFPNKKKRALFDKKIVSVFIFLKEKY